VRIYFLIFIALIFFIVSGCGLAAPHLQRGKQYLDNSNYEKAVRELEKASNESGDIHYYIDTYQHLGRAYDGQGQPLKAVSVYRTAIQMIHLELREISGRRLQLRKDMIRTPGNVRALQQEDMLLAKENLKLERELDDIKGRLEQIKKKQRPQE